MKRLKSALLGAALLFALPAIGQWTSERKPDGTWACVSPTATFDTGYISRQYANARCGVLTILDSVFGQNVAEAALSLDRIQRCADGLMVLTDPTCLRDDAATLNINDSLLPNLLNVTASFSANYRSAVTGTEAAAATCNIVYDSGDDAATNGWSLSGDNIINDAMDTGTSGALRYSCVGATLSALSDAHSWSIPTPGGTDTADPPVGDWADPVSVSDTGQIELRILQGSDDRANFSGLATYNFYRDKAVDGSPSFTLAAPDPGVPFVGTNVELGTVDGAGTYTWTGNDLEITCPDADAPGFDGWLSGASVGVNGCAVLIEISGDFRLRWGAGGTTGGNGSFMDYGAVVFDSATVAGVDGTEGFCWASNQEASDQTNQRDQDRCKPSSGSGFTDHQNALRSPRVNQLIRSGDTWTRGHRTASTYPFATGTSYTQAFPSAVVVGLFCTDNDGTAGVTCLFEDVALTTGIGALSTTDTITGTHNYIFTAEDAEGNESLGSPEITATAGAPPSPGTYKWRPGPLVAGNSFGSSPLQNNFTEICAMTNVVGVQIVMRWSQLETGSTTAGASYTFSTLQSYVNTMDACGKVVVLQLQRQAGGMTNPGPAYLRNEAQYDGGTYYVQQYDDTHIKAWVPAIMDRYIALENALAAQFEDQDAFYGIIFPETVFGGTTPTAEGWTLSGWVTQIKRMLTARLSVFPTTNKITFANFLNTAGTSTYVDLMNAIRDSEGVVGGPDIYPQGIGSSGCGAGCTNPGTVETRTAGQNVYAGITGGNDYRDEMTCMTAIQPPEMGGRKGNHTPANLFAEGNGVLDCGNLFWWYKTYQLDTSSTPGSGGVDEANWNSGGTLAPNGLKAFINAGSANASGDALTCPENYSGGCQ